MLWLLVLWIFSLQRNAAIDILKFWKTGHLAFVKGFLLLATRRSRRLFCGGKGGFHWPGAF